MDTDDDIRALAERFFDAIEQGDITTMQGSFTPDAAIWHNTDEAIVTPEQTARTLTGMVARIKDRSYAERRLRIFPGGFVQQHALTGRRVQDDVAVPPALRDRVRGQGRQDHAPRRIFRQRARHRIPQIRLRRAPCPCCARSPAPR